MWQLKFSIHSQLATGTDPRPCPGVAVAVTAVTVNESRKVYDVRQKFRCPWQSETCLTMPRTLKSGKLALAIIRRNALMVQDRIHCLCQRSQQPLPTLARAVS